VATGAPFSSTTVAATSDAEAGEAAGTRRSGMRRRTAMRRGRKDLSLMRFTLFRTRRGI
jgi:hypothetical protein